MIGAVSTKNENYKETKSKYKLEDQLILIRLRRKIIRMIKRLVIVVRMIKLWRMVSRILLIKILIRLSRIL